MVSPGSSSSSGSSQSRTAGPSLRDVGDESNSTFEAVAVSGEINNVPPSVIDNLPSAEEATEDMSMQGRRHTPRGSAPPVTWRTSRSGDDKALPPTPPVPSSTPAGGMFRKLTTKLRSTPPVASGDAAAPQPEISRPRRKAPMRLPSMPKAPVPNTSQNDFTSSEQRQAALRARGLIPAIQPQSYRDAQGYMIPLSEQERVLDKKRAVVVPDPTRVGSDGEESEAKRIREAWQAKNRPAPVPGTAEPERGSMDKDFAFPAGAGAKGPAEVDNHSVATTVPSEFRMAAEVSAMLDQQDGLAAVTVLVHSARPSPEPMLVDSDAAPTSPSNESSDMSHMVSRWMDESSKLPSNCSGPIAGTTQMVTPSSAAPAVSFPPAAAAAPPPSNNLVPSSPPQLMAVSSDPNAEYPDSPTLGTALVPEVPSSRGRSFSLPQAHPDAGAGARRGRHAAMPALSPTRTASSSGASLSVQTPTTASQSYENQAHGCSRPPDLHGRADTTVIAESPVENDERRSVEVPEFGEGQGRVMDPPEFTLTMDKERRRSITQAMFGIKSVAEQPASLPEPQRSTSMLRKLSSKLQIKTKPLPAPSPGAFPETIPERPTSALQTSAPPSAFPGLIKTRTVGIGPRISSRSRSRSREPTPASPRQTLLVQVHNHQSLVVHAGRIEDEESRRLSEMAFLDY